MRALEALHRYGLSQRRHALERLPRQLAKAVFLSSLVVRDAAPPRAAALARYWGWQVRRRLFRAPVAVRFPTGYRFTIPHWSEIGGMIVAVGSHEPLETRFLARLLRPHDLFVDVGANIGFYTHLAAAAGADVVAFEPGDQAREAMETSLAGAGLAGRVRVAPFALADRDGEAWLSEGDVRRRLTAAGPEGSAVAVRRLDGVLDTLYPGLAGTLPFTVLKVDAEGHDLEVLVGGTETLSRLRPVVMVETWSGGTEIRQFLHTLNYAAYLLDEEASLIPCPDNWTGQANMIGVARGPAQVVFDGRMRERPVLPLHPPTVDSWR